MQKKTFLVMVWGVFCLASLTMAEVPQVINYQGHLTDSAGNPLDTTIGMTFSIYDAATNGDWRWRETHPSVTVTNGLFNVLLGSVHPIPDSIFAGSDCWLGIAVGIVPIGEGEISPRTCLASVPYAIHAGTVDGTVGGVISGDLHITGKLILGSNEKTVVDGEILAPAGILRIAKEGAGGSFDPNIKVGIGTEFPTSRLHIASVGSSWGTPALLIDNTSTFGGGQSVIGFKSDIVIPYYNWEFGVDGAAGLPGRLILIDQRSNAFKLLFDFGLDAPVSIQPYGGYVGIGTSTPEAMLHLSNTSNTDANTIIRLTEDDGSGGVANVDLRAFPYQHWNNVSGCLEISSTIWGRGELHSDGPAYIGIPPVAFAPMVSQMLLVNGGASIGTDNVWVNAPINGAIISGNVGIGTASPQARLHVSQSSNTDFAAVIENSGGVGKGLLIKSGAGSGAGGEYAIFEVQRYSGSDLIPVFRVNGKSGTTYAREIEVSLSAWPDHVFEENYPLMPLEEVERYIDMNGCLPGIPSEENVISNGINLGEMNAKLLQKIEELTLYLIDLKEENERLETRITSLENPSGRRGKQ